MLSCFACEIKMTNSKIDAVCEELRLRLKDAADRNIAQGILFSGGVDTSILALLSPEIVALNVRLDEYGEDTRYAEIVAQRLGLQLHIKQINVEEAFEIMPRVIMVLRSFDPALPNDLALYFALKLAREKGLDSIITGDGSDELFAGYSYMSDLDLKKYLPSLARRMQFSSRRLGSHLGVTVKQPFLDNDFINYALSIEPALKIRQHEGTRYGKWILRKAFESFLPEEIVWQDKRPIETGSGFSHIREIISSRISEQDLAKAESTYSVKFLSKDHLYYYQIYREVVGEIPPPQPGEVKCPGCGTGRRPGSYHCRTCGWSVRRQ